jgi:hypothetical protein
MIPMDLSPEDRQRIYLEEKARFEAQESLKAEAKTNKYAGCGMPVLAILLGVVVLVIFASLFGPGSEPRKTYTVAIDWYCGDQGSAATAAVAADAGDKAGIAGLVARGKLLPVKAGTRVSSGGLQDSGLTFVAVESGVSIGESCWVPTRLLR